MIGGITDAITRHSGPFPNTIGVISIHHTIVRAIPEPEGVASAVLDVIPLDAYVGGSVGEIHGVHGACVREV